MLDLSEQHLQILVSVLDRFLPSEVQVLVFGSRVNGTARRYSDIDLCLKCDRDIPDKAILNLQEAFSLSELPFRVDIVIYRNCTGAFRQIIDENSLKIYPK